VKFLELLEEKIKNKKNEFFRRIKIKILKGEE